MKNSLGTFIAQLRKEKGLTQKQLAEILGVSDKTVSHWEREESSPDISLLPEIAKVFKITVDELLGGEKKSLPSDTESASEIIETGFGESSVTPELTMEKHFNEFVNKNIFSALVSILSLVCGFIVLYFDSYDASAAVLILILIVSGFISLIFRNNFGKILLLNKTDDESLLKYKQRANRITALNLYLILLISSFSLYFLNNIFAVLALLPIDAVIIFVCELFLRKKEILHPKGYSKKTKMLFVLNAVSVLLVCLIIFGGCFLQLNFNEVHIIKNNAQPEVFNTADELKSFMSIYEEEPDIAQYYVLLFDTSYAKMESDEVDFGAVWYKDNSGKSDLITFEWNNNSVCFISPNKKLPFKAYTYSSLEKARNENIALINSLNFIYIAYYLITLSSAILVYIAVYKRIKRRYSIA